MIKKRTGKDWSHPLSFSNFKAYLASQHYTEFLAEADRLGVNFLAHPEMLAEVEIAVEAACIFWEDNNLNKYADSGEFKALNGIVNKGDAKKTALHWDKRNALYSLCKRRIPQNFGLLPAPVVTTALGNSSYTTQVQPPAVLNQASLPDLQSNKQDEQNQQLARNDASENGLQSNKPDNDFLQTIISRNVSSDAVKSAVPSLGKRLWRFIARPLMLFYALLEAGNIAAWLGVVTAIIIIGLLIYWHREDFKKLLQTLKGKFTE